MAFSFISFMLTPPSRTTVGLLSDYIYAKYSTANAVFIMADGSPLHATKYLKEKLFARAKHPRSLAFRLQTLELLGTILH